MQTPPLKVPAKETFHPVYACQQDGEARLSNPQMLPLTLILGCEQDGEIERICLKIVKRDGRTKDKWIWRYTDREYRIHDESCTMGPLVIEKLVQALCAGHQCMMTQC